MFTPHFRWKSFWIWLGNATLIIGVASAIGAAGVRYGDLMAEREQIALQNNIGNLQSSNDQIERTNNELLRTNAEQKARILTVETEGRAKDARLRESDIKLAALSRTAEENRALLRASESLTAEISDQRRRIEELRAQCQAAASDKMLLEHIEKLSEEKWHLLVAVERDTEFLNELSGLPSGQVSIGSEDGSITYPRDPRFQGLDEAEIDNIRENYRAEIEIYREQIRSIDELISGIYAKIGIHYTPRAEGGDASGG